MAEQESYGPFEKLTEVDTSFGVYTVPAGKVLTVDGEGYKKFSDPEPPKPKPKAPAKKPAARKAATKKGK